TTATFVTGKGPRPRDRGRGPSPCRTDRRAGRQYESLLMVSAPSLVPRAHQTFRATVSLMNLTLPSPIRTFTPPECLREAGSEMGLSIWHPGPHPVRQ